MPEQILIGSLPKGLEILKGCKKHVEMVFCIIIKSSIYYMWKRMEVFNEDMSETCYRVQNYTRLVEAYSSCLWGQEQTYEQKSLTSPHPSVICYFEHLELWGMWMTPSLLLSPFWSAVVVPVRVPCLIQIELLILDWNTWNHLTVCKQMTWLI